MFTDIEDLSGADGTAHIVRVDLGSNMEEEQPSSFIAQTYDDDNATSYISCVRHTTVSHALTESLRNDSRYDDGFFYGVIPALPLPAVGDCHNIEHFADKSYNAKSRYKQNDVLQVCNQWKILRRPSLCEIPNKRDCIISLGTHHRWEYSYTIIARRYGQTGNILQQSK